MARLLPGHRLTTSYGKLLPSYRFGASTGPVPAYVSGLTYNREFQQGVALAPFDVRTAFLNADQVTITKGALPAGMTLTNSILGGTPTGFQGRRFVTFRAANANGFAERTILISVKPSIAAGAFGTAYVTDYNGLTVGATTLENVDNLLVRNCTITGQLQLRNVKNALIIDCTISHTAQADGIRISGSAGSCDKLVIYGNTITGVNKDGINLSGDWPIHGPDIHLLNNLITDCGDNADPKEHGMYLHSMAHLVGNVIKNSNFGDAISTRSSANVLNNFCDTSMFAGISYFADHAASGTNPLVIRDNIVVNSSTGANDGDIILRDVADPAKRVGTFDIADNIYTTNRAQYVEIGAGYDTATITQSGNVKYSAAQARGLFPA